MQIAAEYQAIRRYVDDFRPDFIVSTPFSIGTRIATDVLSIKHVSLGLMVNLFPASAGHLAADLDGEGAQLEYHLESYLNKMNRGREQLGLDKISRPYYFENDVTLIRNLEAYEPQSAYLNAQSSYFIGDYLGPMQNADTNLWTWIETQRTSGHKIMFAQPGRSFGEPGSLPRLLEVAEDLNFSIVLDISRLDNTLQLTTERIMVSEYVPVASLALPSDYLVSNGHSTYALLSLKFGLPHIVFPNGSATDMIARRLVKSGCNPLVLSEVDKLTHDLIRRWSRQNDSVSEVRRKVAQQFQTVDAIHQISTALSALF